MRIVLLVGTSVSVLWISPTTAQTTGGAAFEMFTSGTETIAIAGDATRIGETGVVGHAWATSGANFGVRGVTNSTSGIGVNGRASATTGQNFGVRGVTLSAGDAATGAPAYGVFGHATASSGLTIGTGGRSDSTGGIGVEGTSAFGIGVAGQAHSGVGVDGSVDAGVAVRGRLGGAVGELFSGFTSGVEAFGVDGTGRVRIVNPNLGTSCAAVTACTNELFFQDNGQIRSGDDNHRLIFDRIANNMELREYGTIIFSPGATNGSRTQTVSFTPDGGVNLSGKLTAPNGVSTPIAYAFIDSSGTFVKGTSNVSSTFNATSQSYEITITGVSYTAFSFVTVVSPCCSAGGLAIPSVGSVNGKLEVGFHDILGTPVQANFQFITYQP